MKQKFKYYLHDDCNTEERIHNIKSQGVNLPELAWENIGRPFYEICLDCEIDESGNVEILGVIK